MHFALTPDRSSASPLISLFPKFISILDFFDATFWISNSDELTPFGVKFVLKTDFPLFLFFSWYSAKAPVMCFINAAQYTTNTERMKKRFQIGQSQTQPLESTVLVLHRHRSKEYFFLI